MTMTTDIQSLPVELLHAVLSLLRSKDLYRSAFVSRVWRDVALDVLWGKKDVHIKNLMEVLAPTRLAAADIVRPSQSGKLGTHANVGILVLLGTRF